MKTLRHHTSAMEVADLTFRLLTSCQKKEERMALQFGMTIPEFKILLAFRTSRTRHVKEVLEDLGIGASNFSKVAASLEAKGLLSRSIEPQDRRSVCVSLTPRGTALSQKLEAQYIRMHEEILKGIPPELHDSLIQALYQLSESVDRWLHDS